MQNMTLYKMVLPRALQWVVKVQPRFTSKDVPQETFILQGALLGVLGFRRESPR